MVSAYICVKISESPLRQVCKYTRQLFVEVFHLSGQVKGLLLSWCAVPECVMEQGKLKSGLVVVWCFNDDP